MLDSLHKLLHSPATYKPHDRREDELCRCTKHPEVFRPTELFHLLLIVDSKLSNVKVLVVHSTKVVFEMYNSLNTQFEVRVAFGEKIIELKTFYHLIQNWISGFQNFDVIQLHLTILFSTLADSRLFACLLTISKLFTFNELSINHPLLSSHYLLRIKVLKSEQLRKYTQVTTPKEVLFYQIILRQIQILQMWKPVSILYLKFTVWKGSP